MHLTQADRHSPVVTQAVRQADEIGQVARRVPEVREDLAQMHYGHRRLGRERAPRVREPTRESGEAHTDDCGRDVRDGALPPSPAQRCHETRKDQRYCRVGDKQQIAEHPGREQDHCQNPSQAEASPPERGKRQERVQHGADVESPSDKEEPHGWSAKGEEGDDRRTPGKARHCSATVPGDENPDCDHKSRHERRTRVEKRGPQTLEANGQSVEGRVTRPVRGESQVPALKQKVPAGHGLALEDDGRPVGGAGLVVHRPRVEEEQQTTEGCDRGHRVHNDAYDRRP